MEKNHLLSELSPYLLQHARNPVNWYPWGNDAFSKAKIENKLIFLSIGYSACYWCHVMERESFSNLDIAEMLNRDFVSIKVDKEEHPELDDIYMKAVEIITGQGGWPMSVFLTPDLKPFFAGTYFPKEHLMQLLKAINLSWIAKPADILSDADKITLMIQSISGLPKQHAAPLPPITLLSLATQHYQKIFDSLYGGFHLAPKFPQPPVLELLLANYELNHHPFSLSMVTTTLDHMMQGGIYDQVGGGFHRYATDREWMIPHFEKMLYDNAQLIHTYVKAYQLTHHESYKQLAEDIIHYIKREMTSPSGLFYSSQDAEAEGEEGKSYRFSKQELETILSPRELTLVENVYGVKNPPNFGQYYILYLPCSFQEIAQQENRQLEDLHQEITLIREKLLLARQQKFQPLLDDKIITAWNGLMIEALAYAGEILENPTYVAMADRALQSLLTQLIDLDGNLLHMARENKVKHRAYLDDYAAIILGLKALHHATQKNHYHHEAIKLADQMIATFWNAEGSFYYSANSVTHLLTRYQHPYDGALPSGISLAIRALASLTNQENMRYVPFIEATLKTYSSLLLQAPQGFPAMLLGLYTYYQQKQSIPAHISLQTSNTRKSSDVVEMKATLSHTNLAAQQMVDLTIVLTIKKDWHINANPTKTPVLIPTLITASLFGGEIQLHVDYPEGDEENLGGDRIRVYQNTITIYAKLMPLYYPQDISKGEIEITAHLQACNNKGICLAPDTIRSVLPVKLI